MAVPAVSTAPAAAAASAVFMISQHGPYRQCNRKYNDQDQDQINCFHKPVITSVFDSYPSCPVTSGPGKVNAFSGMSYDRPYEMNDHGEDPGNGALPDNHGGSRLTAAIAATQGV